MLDLKSSYLASETIPARLRNLYIVRLSRQEVDLLSSPLYKRLFESADCRVTIDPSDAIPFAPWVYQISIAHMHFMHFPQSLRDEINRRSGMRALIDRDANDQG